MTKFIDDNEKHTLEEALQQFVNSQLRGQEPDIEELVKQYPEHDHQIRTKLHKLLKINNLFDSLVKTDESDFEDITDEYDLIGQKVGSFEIVEVIGRGGMGVVYLARDSRLKRSVAIKSMPTQLKDDSTARMRFKREAELLASLNHPNIAVIYDIIEQDDETGYLVLEYISGKTLSERIAREPLKLKEALSIARQIAEAVSAAHDKGVIHRDLKPGNIKITPDGRVKVLDFGLAKTVDGEPSEKLTTVTQAGRVIGTPAYMSPEQARGKPTDHRTDIWSFGCILYQMLTAHLPFEGETVTDVISRIIERQPDWEALPQEIPTSIRVLLQHCLEKDPDRRLGDIADAAVEIKKTQSNPATAQAVTKTAKSRKVAMSVGVVLISIVLLSIALKFMPQKKIRPSTKVIRLVVLPFENLGSADDEWFAGGMTDEITSRLAGIHGLGVISRQSAIQYKNREKSTPQISKELGVDYILEGTIQREKPSDPNSRVRIRCQLIRASDDTHIWAQNYDNDMSEVFLLQSEVAEQVAEGLDIALLEPERQALQSVPTRNTEAYVYYLRGNEYYHRRYVESDLSNAILMYKRALALDPNLAQVYAQLSRAHSFMYRHYDHSDSRLDMAWKAVEKALKLDPDLPEAHLALGHYYYHGHLDYDLALKEFTIVRKSLPDSSELLYFTGLVQKRQGKFERALANIKKAYELNPLSNNVANEIGFTYMFQRNYPQAARYCEESILLAPDAPKAYNVQAQIYLRWQGSTKKAREVLEEALKNAKGAEYPPIMHSLVNVDVYDSNYQDALDRLSIISEDVDDTGNFSPNALLYALIYGYMDNKELEQAHYESARSILNSKIQEHPEDAQFHSLLGIVYAGLDYNEEAIKEGKLAVDILPVSRDASNGPLLVKNLAHIYVMVGKFDAAIGRLEYLLSIPGELSVSLLQLNPAWDPLRKHPDFIKLVETGK